MRRALDLAEGFAIAFYAVTAGSVFGDDFFAKGVAVVGVALVCAARARYVRANARLEGRLEGRAEAVRAEHVGLRLVRRDDGPGGAA